MSKIKVELEFEPMKNFGGGFRTEWISGKNEDMEIGLDSGGGLGNPLLTFWIEKKGEPRKYFTADMRDLLSQLAEKIT